MIAADSPTQRPADARLLTVDADGRVNSLRRSALPDLIRPGDLVVANDAATIPASLTGLHEATSRALEVRLAGRRSLAPDDLTFQAVVFGEGDYRIRTEDRPSPPPLIPGDRLKLGPLTAVVEGLLGHPRLVSLALLGTPDDVWAGLAHHGRAVQYAHMAQPLKLWDVWTPMAGPPAAFEPPSAGFALDWAMLKAIRARGAGFVTLTHAAGLSSTGDPALDARLPFDEPYRIPPVTAAAIAWTRADGGRVIAVGTTVARALEHARGRAGEGLANQRLGPDSRLMVADAILSGTHEPDTSHYQLLRAFTDDATLAAADQALEREAYRTHEFGDSVWIEKRARTAARVAA